MRGVTRVVVCLAACSLHALDLASQATVSPSRADEPEADPMVRAWLHDLLGSPRADTLAAYRAVLDDATAPGEHRVRAAARALPLATAGADPAEGLWWAQRLVALMPMRETTEPAVLQQRLVATQTALREWANSPSNDLDLERARPLVQRLAAEPWRTLEALANRPVQPADALERLLRAAESRGDAAEATRLRQELDARRQPDGQRPRLMQFRRWARDVLEWELAGQHDKAERLLNVLTRRRPGRGPATLQRLEEAMRTGAGARASPQELRLVERALEEAKKRAAAGDTRGVAALVGPALWILLWRAD